ncbi:ABC transporter ATP-binding protein [Planobispora rosea]|uniref:ABC transporter ATP-binding protein n=1 Tax=Planobispora rosea TaxID=35762 RepID=UPI0016713896|nr:ABC transporter ATP-binding protein [Planobispora rosea]
MMSYAIAVRDLRVRRGRREVLHGVSFDVPRGTVLGLIGPSGCGKTTLMRSIVGVQVVAGGTVTVLGEPAGSPRLRERVGYSTQSPAVYEDLTVAENLAYFASVLGAPKSDVGRVLGEVGLGGQARQITRTLSGGQRSRASLAVALLGNPELLVLDEPTVGLDPVLRNELWGLFRRLAADGGVTLVVSSHVMDEAARCDRLLLMREGDILADDSPGALRRTGEEDLEGAFLRLIAERDEAGTAGRS